MPRVKKVGPSGRFGARYGKGVKKRIIQIERVQKGKHVCPSCLKPGMKRLASGIWYCEKCKAKYAGSSYEPKLE